MGTPHGEEFGRYCLPDRQQTGNHGSESIDVFLREDASAAKQSDRSECSRHQRYVDVVWIPSTTKPILTVTPLPNRLPIFETDEVFVGGI